MDHWTAKRNDQKAIARALVDRIPLHGGAWRPELVIVLIIQIAMRGDVMRQDDTVTRSKRAGSGRAGTGRQLRTRSREHGTLSL